MKKMLFLFICALCFLHPTITAQTYLSQSFEGSFPPANWTLKKVGGVTVKHWEQSSAQYHSGSRCAYHYPRFLYQDAWLISPSLNLSGATNPLLSYWDLVLDASFAGAHNVLVSTNYVSGEPPANYTWDTLVTFIGTNFWQYAGNISLNNFKTNNVFIAWQYLGSNGAYWYVDDVAVMEGGATPANDLCQNALLLDGPFPEAISGNSTWATFDCPENLTFWNGVWYKIALPYSCNTVAMTISALDYDFSSAGIILTEDCSCSSEAFIYADSSAFTSDTSIYIQFDRLPGVDTVFLPLQVTPLQSFSLTVDVTDGCVPPGELNVVAFSENSTDLSWAEEGCATQWEIEYGPWGLEFTGVPSITGINALPYTLGDLEAGQCYVFSVRSVCGPGQYSLWSVPLGFCTNCPATVDSFQYMTNFEPPLWPPNCWNQVQNSDSTWLYGVTTSSPVTSLAFCMWNSEQFQNEWLITPEVDLSLVSHPKLSFNWMTNHYWMVELDHADLNVLVSIDGGSSWLPDTLFNENHIGPFNSWEWQSYEADLSPYERQTQVAFAFVYSGSDGDAFVLDNVFIGPAKILTTWTGSVNNEWFVKENWDNFVPCKGATVQIPPLTLAMPNAPVTNNTVCCQSLETDQNSQLTVQDGTRLLIGTEGHGTQQTLANYCPGKPLNKITPLVQRKSAVTIIKTCSNSALSDPHESRRVTETKAFARFPAEIK